MMDYRVASRPTPSRSAPDGQAGQDRCGQLLGLVETTVAGHHADDEDPTGGESEDPIAGLEAGHGRRIARRNLRRTPGEDVVEATE
jgi:hypothetical protein